MSSSLLKRLDLQSSASKFDDMLQGVEDVANLPDPAGQITYASKLDEGLTLHRVTCQWAMLWLCERLSNESTPRPDWCPSRHLRSKTRSYSQHHLLGNQVWCVKADASALCFHLTSHSPSGNAAILKGGKESLHTQAAMTQVIQSALSRTSIPSAYIQTVATRDEISSLLQQDKYIDLVIPRGSNSLVKNIQHSTRIPVMGHADGLCCIYLDEEMDVKKACRIVVDAKVRSRQGSS